MIGVGHLGRHHARLLATLDDVELTAVVDTVPERAAAAAEATGARALSDYRELIDRVDAVTVAVPTELHAEIARPFLDRGVAVLVEKPMATSVGECRRMIDACKKAGVELSVIKPWRYRGSTSVT